MAPNFCPGCGLELLQFSEAEVCPDCGARIKTAAPGPTLINQKEPFFAAILSFLIPGLGQLYNGEVGKGIAYFLIACVCGALIFVVIGFILYPLWFIYQIYDAYASAVRINQNGQRM
jgi:TM2 domain-containing membrane protein YozV